MGTEVATAAASFQDHGQRPDPDSSVCPGPGRGSGKGFLGPHVHSVHTCASLMPRALPVCLCPGSTKEPHKQGPPTSGARTGPLRKVACGLATNRPVLLRRAHPACLASGAALGPRHGPETQTEGSRARSLSSAPPRAQLVGGRGPVPTGREPEAWGRLSFASLSIF